MKHQPAKSIRRNSPRVSSIAFSRPLNYMTGLVVSKHECLCVSLWLHVILFYFNSGCPTLYTTTHHQSLFHLLLSTSHTVGKVLRRNLKNLFVTSKHFSGPKNRKIRGDTFSAIQTTGCYWNEVQTTGCYWNELVINEIRNNVSAIFHNILSSCCKIEFVLLW